MRKEYRADWMERHLRDMGYYGPTRPLRIRFGFDMNTARPDFTGNPEDEPITLTKKELADLINLAVKLGRGTETYLTLAAWLERYGIRRNT